MNAACNAAGRFYVNKVQIVLKIFNLHLTFLFTGLHIQ